MTRFCAKFHKPEDSRHGPAGRGADLAQLVQQWNQSFARPLRHQTYLYPVSLEQIVAPVTEHISGIFELPAQIAGTQWIGKSDSNHGRRCVRVGSYYVIAQLAQPALEPHGQVQCFNETIR